MTSEALDMCVNELPRVVDRQCGKFSQLHYATELHRHVIKSVNAKRQS